ncbi:hypothetical protein Xbud_01544 [Xenorhabdus budapestensis]|uniref:Uncharacterized protein n=1 Tax=Xenorhabdus budapestensis TaxID=290110 RepID=A0A2D0J1E8_XENBU|nr:hypothetical protein Xbud_01544 [Xenorhabdus budapestensis]
MMGSDIFYYCIEKYKYYQLIPMKWIFCYDTKKKEL